MKKTYITVLLFIILTTIFQACSIWTVYVKPECVKHTTVMQADDNTNFSKEVECTNISNKANND